ncbi:integrin alpha [Phytomonospora endophytica]|uniref:FG-GAP repeat protein n=1 Tax=Phytomonospora endophytica TaxID=714109 RepID=A0A841FPP2_9ACTN|nr:integrin alpha [Phytomonospora endophytica]MBB6035227.1 hypothetical protein [Phytomonospora endophytica]GIG64023.1 hypothetical protein Pen01_03180 [Phytomonospora endophytica]
MPASRRTALLTAALLAAATAPLVTATPAHAASCVSAVDNDFDGDGVRDLAVGDPFTAGGGRVVVTHSRTGLATVIDQATAGVPGNGVNGDFFGFALASYDRDLDGCDDLVVGGPGETVGTKAKTGAVWVVPGSPTGLNPAASVMLTQDTAGFPGANENNDLFGYALAAGNFGSQRFLAIGVPGETVGASASNAGQVVYQRGSTTAALTQDTAGVPGIAELGDRFGETLAATPQHIVVGVPGENAGEGLVHVFAHRLTDGRPTPVKSTGQDTAGVPGVGEPGDRFGGQLSAVAFRPGGGGTGTLVAVSVTGEDVRENTVTDAGIVHALYFGTDGSFRQLAEYSQDAAGVEGDAGSDDQFGRTVALTNTGTAAEGTPATTVLTVGARGAENPDPRLGALQVFRLSGAPGDGDLWIAPGTHGLPANAIGGNTRIGSSRDHLYVEGHLPDGVGAAVHGLRWRDLLAGQSPPARTWPVPGTGVLIWAIS